MIANAAYAKASGDESAAENARLLLVNVWNMQQRRACYSQNLLLFVRPEGIGVPMILMNTAQQLRETIGDPRCDACIDQFISEIETYFVKHDLQCVMEQVAPDGSIIDHIDGRTLNPGHAKEVPGLFYTRPDTGITIHI